ncbi:MAG: HAD family phosphatase [Clostridiaceae bacterium]
MGHKGRPELVIFDMDGTLIDSEPASIESWVTALKEAGQDAVFEDILPFIGKNMKLIKKEAEIRWHGLDFEAIFKRQKELMIQNHNSGAVLKPGILEVLQLLEEQGIKKCVATSSTKSRAERIMKSLDLESRFDFLITGEDVIHSKPDPEIFLKCIEKAGIEPEKSMIIEDSKNGIIAARRSGAVTVLIPDIIKADDEMRECADHVFDSMDGFNKYFVNL